MKAAIGIAAALSVAFVAMFHWWFQSTALITVGYALLSLITIASVPLCYRWFGFLDDDIITGLLQREQREHSEMMQRLKDMENDLDALDNKEGAKHADTLTKLMNDFHEIIANRFRGKQLSSSTFLNAARRVQNQALQNLSDMVGIGHSIESLKRHQSSDSDKQLAAQQQRLDELIAENKKLFQALSDTSIEVANIQEIDAFERTETLARLNDLADIAKQQSM